MKIEVGKKYRNNHGDTIQIVSNSKVMGFDKFYDDEDFSYDANGICETDNYYDNLTHEVL